MTSVLLWLATAPSRARLKVLTWRWKWRLSNNLSLISQALCYRHRAQELSECRGGRLGLPVPNSPMLSVNLKQHLSCSISELRSCVKVEVDVLGSPSLIVLTVSVDVKQHSNENIIVVAIVPAVVVKCCLMSPDVSWHIRDKLWPMPRHGSIILYVHGNQKAR